MGHQSVSGGEFDGAFLTAGQASCWKISRVWKTRVPEPPTQQKSGRTGLATGGRTCAQPLRRCWAHCSCFSGWS